jgi:hypothetical protein
MNKTKKIRQPIRSGTLTIVIACVMILLSVLSMLSLTTAEADLALAERQVVFAQQSAQGERAGQEWLAEMDDYLRGAGVLPEETTEDGDTYSARINIADGFFLDVSAERNNGHLMISKWELSVDQSSFSSLPEDVEPLTESAGGGYDILPETSSPVGAGVS